MRQGLSLGVLASATSRASVHTPRYNAFLVNWPLQQAAAMKHLSPFQAITPASSRFFRLCATVLQPQGKRHQSSYRRSRSRLNIKPDASFLPSKTEAHDHIIHNPPPSAPNVYHTPTIFLPKSDRRRQIHDAAIAANPQLANTMSSGQTKLPPPVRKPYEKKYHVTEEQMNEMRALRKEDPMKWSASQLAKKYECSSLFVSFVTDGSAQTKKEQQQQVTAFVQSRWGPKRRIAREDRQLRQEKWYRDE